MYFLVYLFDILSTIYYITYDVLFYIPSTIYNSTIFYRLRLLPYSISLWVILPGGLPCLFGFSRSFNKSKRKQPGSISCEANRSDRMVMDQNGTSAGWNQATLPEKKRLNSLGISQVWSRISAEVSIFLPGMNKVSGLKIPPLLVYNWLEILAQESPEPGTLTEYMSGW